ncbi:MAG: isoprenylcysteine carboxylmethyltransferase family protein [Smithella sp.]
MARQYIPKAARNTLKSLILLSIRNFFIAVIALGIVLCLLAGTLNYWQGWVFTILFVALVTQQGIYLSIKDPKLLERRKQIVPAGESTRQKIFIIAGLLGNICLIVFSALDYRFEWSQMSSLVSLVGDGLVVFSFLVYYFVFRENSYAASSIQTFEGQQVISTGPYALMRHPKYGGDIILVVGIPLALGSWWGLAFIVLVIAALMWRILDEEKLLMKDLPGYVEYTQKVPYRIVPYLW